MYYSILLLALLMLKSLPPSISLNNTPQHQNQYSAANDLMPYGNKHFFEGKSYYPITLNRRKPDKASFKDINEVLNGLLDGTYPNSLNQYTFNTTHINTNNTDIDMDTFLANLVTVNLNIGMSDEGTINLINQIQRKINFKSWADTLKTQNSPLLINHGFIDALFDKQDVKEIKKMERAMCISLMELYTLEKKFEDKNKNLIKDSLKEELIKEELIKEELIKIFNFFKKSIKAKAVIGLTLINAHVSENNEAIKAALEEDLEVSTNELTAVDVLFVGILESLKNCSFLKENLDQAKDKAQFNKIFKKLYKSFPKIFIYTTMR